MQTICFYKQSTLPGESRPSDTSMADILKCLRDNCDPSKLYHPAMVSLLRLDARKGTDYARTLYTYLVNERNNTVTAAELYMHRNTLLYRLRRIQSLIEVDLENDSTRSHLKMTYDILAYSKGWINDPTIR